MIKNTSFLIFLFFFCGEYFSLTKFYNLFFISFFSNSIMDIPKLSYPYTLVGDALDRMSDDSKRTIINPLMAMYLLLLIIQKNRTRGLSPDAPIPAPEYSRFTESCLVSAALSAVMGGGVGLLTGLLFGSFDAMSGPTTATLSQTLPLKEEVFTFNIFIIICRWFEVIEKYG